jgi:hypothetical protein
MNCGVHECALRNQLIIMRSCAAADDFTKLVTAYICLGCARSFHQASASPHRFALLSFLGKSVFICAQVSQHQNETVINLKILRRQLQTIAAKKNSSKYFWNLYRSSITTRSMPTLIIVTSITQQK